MRWKLLFTSVNDVLFTAVFMENVFREFFFQFFFANRDSTSNLELDYENLGFLGPLHWFGRKRDMDT
jgi:hypothetical protein